MMWIILGLLLTGLLFGGPALVALINNQMDRRRDAAEARRQAEEQRRQEAEAARQQVEYIWRNSPDRAGVGEYVRYQAYRTPFELAVNRAARRHALLDQEVGHRLFRYPGQALPSTRYRLVVLTGLVLFLGVFALAITLDFLIFRGLHPTGSVVLPLGLACLAVLGITVGSVIMFGAKRHDLLPDGISHYFRRVIITGGTLLAIGVAAYMIMIAPYRSYPAGEAAINHAEQVQQADLSAVPKASQQVLNLDQAAINQAKANLANAQKVDRLSAAALSLVEIPLSEAAVLGGELLVLYLAIARRERASQEQQEAQGAMVESDNRFIAQLTQILITHGHNEQSVNRIIARVNAMKSSSPGGSGGPGGPASGSPGGPAPGGHTPPGGPAPGGPAPPAVPGATSTVTHVPYGGPVTGGPTLPGGPGAPGAPVGTTTPPEMATIASLPVEDLDQTE